MAENQLDKAKILGWGLQIRKRLIWPVRTNSRAIFRRLQAGARRQLKKLRNGVIRKIKSFTQRLSKLVGDLSPKKDKSLESPFAIALSLSQEVSVEEKIRWAKKRLPTAPDHALNVISMNMAATTNRWADWNAALGSYLAGWDTPPIQLETTERVFDFSKLRAPTVSHRKTGGDLVSVLMPVYNRQSSVKTAAQSILNQTWENLELLIVDDASTDETWKRLVELAETDNRVRIFRNKVNAGPYVSRNVGWLSSKGDWITVHDSDDWAHPLRIERTIDAATSSNFPAVAAFQLRVTNEGVTELPKRQNTYAPDGVARKALSSLLLSRDLMSRLGAWDSVRFGGDSELISRLETVSEQRISWLPFISMLCGSSTSNLSRQWTVPLRLERRSAREAYVDSYRKWHRSLSAREPIPAAPTSRPFPVRKQLLVPASHALRNIPGDFSLSTFEPVTVICVTRRPEKIQSLIANVVQQDYPLLSLVLVTHGFRISVDTLVGLNHLASFVTCEIGRRSHLGDGLNHAMELAPTDLLAKMDDDDIYLPPYLRNLVIAERCLDPKPVLVGKGKYFAYLEGLNLMMLRGLVANGQAQYVSGATMLWRKSLTAGIHFASVPVGTDTRFQKEVSRRGYIFSADPYDFIVLRRAEKKSHTWKIEDQDFLQSGIQLGHGLDVPIACSSFSCDPNLRGTSGR